MAMLLDQPSFTQSTDRGPSPGLWAKAPTISALQDNPSMGYCFWDDFDTFPAVAAGTTANKGPKWVSTTGTAATLQLSAQGDTGYAEGGWLKCLTSTSADAGTQLQAAGDMFIPKANRTIWFEVSVNINVLSQGVAFGLSEAVASQAVLTNSTTLGSANFIGHKCLTGDGVIKFESIKASSTALAKTSTTAVAATTVKLGFKVVGLTQVNHYVNGVLQSTTALTASIPIVGLRPSLSFLSSAANARTSSVDWVKCIQSIGETTLTD